MAHRREDIAARLAELRAIIGQSAVRYLRRGGTLSIWRRSSPHNWFTNNRGGDGYYWHSGEPPRRLPDLAMFELVNEANAKIPRYWGSDSGMSEQSFYRLRRQFRYRGAK